MYKDNGFPSLRILKDNAAPLPRGTRLMTYTAPAITTTARKAAAAMMTLLAVVSWAGGEAPTPDGTARSTLGVGSGSLALEFTTTLFYATANLSAKPGMSKNCTSVLCFD